MQLETNNNNNNVNNSAATAAAAAMLEDSVEERYKKLLEQQTLYLRLQVLQQNAMLNALQGNTESMGQVREHSIPFRLPDLTPLLGWISSPQNYNPKRHLSFISSENCPEFIS